MRAWLPAVLALAACHGGHAAAPAPKPGLAPDPTGPHAEAIAALAKPFIDGEIVSGLVIGVYDGTRFEIYGFGAGPGGKPPTGHTLFEIGSITKVFTSLLLADAVEKRELELDAPLADLLPPGVTSPTIEHKVITLKMLALHSSGLPRLPPSLVGANDKPDPYVDYHEDGLYADLNATALESPPGTQITYSNFGAGVLGFVLGKKLGGGYGAALASRVLAPLDLRDTVLGEPPALAARRAQGTTADLKPAHAWGWDALAGAGGLVSDAHDLLALAVAELDSSQGGDRPLVHAMKLTQEPALQHEGDNEGLGWFIDSAGRYWHNGATGGFHSFVGFDPKARRAVVVLASTQYTPIDHLADLVYDVLAGKPAAPPPLPRAAAMAPYVGTYDFTGTQIEVVQEGKRLYIAGPGEPRHRLIPLSKNEYWVEELQGIAAFERDAQNNLVLVFVVGNNRLTATRVGLSPPPERPPPVPVPPAPPPAK